MADAEVPVDALVGDPVAELAALNPRRNPAIPLPGQLFPRRENSAGVDLADPLLRAPLLAHLHELASLRWEAEPTAVVEHGAGASTGSARAGGGNGKEPRPAQPELVEGQEIRSADLDELQSDARELVRDYALTALGNKPMHVA